MNTVTKETTNSFWGFFGRVIVAQLLTYFFMGVLAVGAGIHIYAYYGANPDPLFTALQRPMESPLVMAGPLFQILRAAIFAVALYPFRSVFLERKWGARPSPVHRQHHPECGARHCSTGSRRSGRGILAG